MEDEQKKNIINFDDMPPAKEPWRLTFIDPRRKDGSRSIRKFDPEEEEQAKEESKPETE